MRICLLGAECTGKTTLATALADALGALPVHEYLRDFVATHGRTPSQLEQHSILHTQIAREEAALAQAAQRGLAGVVCDTAPLLTAIYSAHYFGDDSLFPAALAHHDNYTHTLLLVPDGVPWQADGAQRDGPEARLAIHQRLLGTLAHAGIAYTAINGAQPARLQAALATVRAQPQHT